MGEQLFWVRTEQGRVWGPYTLGALQRMRGHFTVNCEVSLDNKTWRAGPEVDEVKELLAPARKVEKQQVADAAPRLSPALQKAFKVAEPPAPAPVPAAPPPAEAIRPAPPPPPPVVEKPVELPESGDLGEVSPVRLYAVAALTQASGWLQLELEKGRMLQLSFRRGAPEHLSSDEPDLSLLRFLQQRGVVSAEKALAAEEQATKTGQDLLSVLFQLQLIPPADAHRLLGDYALFLLDRALLTWRGKFTFEKDAPSPPGAFPLGPRWTLLAEAVRRMDPTALRARLGKKLLRPLVRSGGLGVGKVDELALNAQESRLFASIDGTRTGEQVLQTQQDASGALRILYLLTELGHLSFAEVVSEEPTPAPPRPAAPRVEAPPQKPVRELPKTAREAGRVPPAGGGARHAQPPPVMQAHAPPVMQAHAPPVMSPAAKSAATPAPGKPPPAAANPSATPAPGKPPPAAAKPAATPSPATPSPSKPPPPMGPLPKWATPPPNETPEAQLARLHALFEKLSAADHFEALGLDRKTGSAAEAKRNFFVLARELHPDTIAEIGELKLAKERLFARINEAAQVLTDDKKRAEYVAELEGKANSVDVARIFAAEESFQRAEIMIKARKYQEGLELLEKAIELNADEAEFYAWRGYARFLVARDRKEAYDASAADCKKAISMVNKCLPAHLFLGHMAKVVGDLKLAQNCYTRVLQLEPKHVEAQRELRLMGKRA